MLFEKQQGIAHYNKDNSAQVQGVLRKYESVSRTTVRLLWYLEFFSILLQRMVSTNESFSDACKQAYNTAMAPNHSTVVVMAAKAGMMFLPATDKFHTLYFFASP